MEDEVIRVVTSSDPKQCMSYLFDKKNKKEFLEKFEELENDENKYITNIRYGFRSDIKCYFIDIDYYDEFEVDDEEDVKAITAAVVAAEVERVTNSETRMYEKEMKHIEVLGSS